MQEVTDLIDFLVRELKVNEDRFLRYEMKKDADCIQEDSLKVVLTQLLEDYRASKD